VPLLRTSRATLPCGVATCQLTLDELWYHYFRAGGTAGLMEVDASSRTSCRCRTSSETSWPTPSTSGSTTSSGARERPYTFHLRTELPRTGHLAAVLQLLTGMKPRTARPVVCRWPDCRAGTGRRARHPRVDVRAGDAASRGGRSRPPDVQAIDTTLAGQCFRDRCDRMAHDSELWVPMLDGLERVGVLRVRTGRWPPTTGPAGAVRLAGQAGRAPGRLHRAYGDALDAIPPDPQRVDRRRS
jgi:hypothetical protein